MPQINSFGAQRPNAALARAAATQLWQLAGWSPYRQDLGFLVQVLDAKNGTALASRHFEDAAGVHSAELLQGARPLGVFRATCPDACLQALCDALASDEAHFDGPECGTHRWRKVRSLWAAPGSRGQDVDVYETACGARSLAHVAARAASGPCGYRSGFNLYLENCLLAFRIAQATLTGMLSFHPAKR